MIRRIALVGCLVTGVVAAQEPAAFDVVSIKRNTAGPQAGGGIRNLPDGTLIMVNQPIGSIILAASPVPVEEFVGAPEWVNAERYDVTAKPPPGATRDQRAQMWRTLFAELMRLVAHVEGRERETFALVLARSAGRATRIEARA